jgi:uncharacterized protein YdeI (YjbR/CyaY-like superfamily)
MTPGEPAFFATPADLRAWLQAHHTSATELLVGFYKKGSGRPSITWPESVDEALCVGWIDGIRRSLGEEAYTIRFTPRRPRSVWSAVNIRRAGELIQEGRMQPEGVQAFEARSEDRSRVYSYERRHQARLSPEMEAEFRRSPEAWGFFQAQPQGYRNTATHWVISARQEATRSRRLATLIQDSAAGRRLASLTRPGSG